MSFIKILMYTILTEMIGSIIAILLYLTIVALDFVIIWLCMAVWVIDISFSISLIDCGQSWQKKSV